MRTLLAGLALLLLPATASAGVLSCSFTEPFFTIEYDPATGAVTRISPDGAGPHGHEFSFEVVAEGARLTRDDVWQGHTSATLRDASGAVLLVVRFTGNGSDGMSDRVFPMEGQWGPEPVGNNVGGCATEKAPGFDLYELFQELGLEP